MSTHAAPTPRTATETQLYKTVVVLATLVLVLAVLCVSLATRAPHDDPTRPDAGLRDTAREAEQIAAMASGSSGTWDSHPDADVARVLQPSVADRDYVGHAVSSNRFGMHEREYAVPKPEGVVRVVLLGDSFVFGHGVDTDERLGVLLERALDGRRQDKRATVEVLHFGIPGWNLLAECAFLRRQLSLLQPDLVVHFSVSNDLSDTTGVRGFGAMSKFVPRRPEQADVIIRQGHARWALDAGAAGHLARGLDGESAARFDEAGAALERMVAALEQSGGRYLHIFNWAFDNPSAGLHLAPRLRPEQISWLPLSFAVDDAMRLNAGDPHWSPAGHEQVARHVFGLITARDLLPGLALLPWRDASELAADLDQRGDNEAHAPRALANQLSAREIPAALDMAARTPESSALVHGGVDAEGLVGPYASIMLARQDGRRLVLRGHCLDRPELDGATLSLFIDEQLVASEPLSTGRTLAVDVPLPPASSDRPCVSLRCVADDFVYTGTNLRDCVSWVLESVAVEP